MARASTSGDEGDSRTLQAERYEILMHEGATASPVNARHDEAPATLRQNPALLERLRLLAVTTDEPPLPVRSPPDEDDAPRSAEPMLLQRPISSRARLEACVETMESARATKGPELHGPSAPARGRASSPTLLEASPRPRTRRWQSERMPAPPSTVGSAGPWQAFRRRLSEALGRLFRRSMGGGQK